MNEIMIFNNPDFGEIRSMPVKGEPWFVGKDVAAALGYNDTDQAIRKHVETDDKLTRKFDGSGKTRNMTIINESGLYSLILGSKLPSAKAFKHWVTAEVLPSIRKTGGYSMRPMTEYQHALDEARRKSAQIQSAKLLLQLAEQYTGDYKQVLHAHATKELTGDFLLPLPELAEKTYSAAEIGEMLGISANKVGVLANRHNLKTG